MEDYDDPLDDKTLGDVRGYRFGDDCRARGWASRPGGGRRYGRTSKAGDGGELPNVPGKSITAVLVSYPPGGKSAKHHHAGSVFVYVLSGAIRSESSTTGPAKVYNAGESFFEPPGSEHLISENASTAEPASLLAVFVADDGAQLTSFDK